MPVVSSEPSVLVDHLHTAFMRESNAYARYAAFAVKAAVEGWPGIASLFRAVGRSEQIHAGNHGRILHQLGGDTDYHIDSVEARSTQENLNTAIGAEILEVRTILPEFIEEARAACDVAAARTFRWALEAEKTHARLFNEALARVEVNDRESWATMAHDFYVCPVCGYTSEVSSDASLCPTCNCAWTRFEAIR